jgi:hypothetical protein
MEKPNFVVPDGWELTLFILLFSDDALLCEKPIAEISIARFFSRQSSGLWILSTFVSLIWFKKSHKDGVSVPHFRELTNRKWNSKRSSRQFKCLF